MRFETWRRWNIFFLTFFGFSLFFYFLLNGGAYWRILRYNLFLHSPLASADLKVGDILTLPSQAAGAGAPKITSGGYELLVPKIDVAAPIAVPEDGTKKGILASLEEGVGLYPGSAEPGERGRIIILGHSSRASWYRGDYATIFAVLPELKEFDTFFVAGGWKKYTYQVFARKILSPADTNVLLATPSLESEVDLVTCYPIGSASKRTVIQAKLIAAQAI